MMLRAVLLAALCGWALGENWGPLVTSSIGADVEGSVHLVNEHTIQLVNFRVKQPSLKVRVQLSDGASAADYEALYHRKASKAGDEFLRPINLGSQKLIPHRSRGLVLVLRFAESVRAFPTLLLSDRKGAEVARVSLARAVVPSSEALAVGGPFDEPSHIPYDSHADAVYAVSDRSFVLTAFRFDGRRPPDGWVYASARPFSRQASQGLRLKMEGLDAGFGADGSSRHCAMTSKVAESRITVVLPPGQSVCDVRYLGVYCYAYGEDFGHTALRIDPKACGRLQPYLPPVRTGELPLPAPNCLKKQQRDGKGDKAVDNWDYYGGQ